MDLNHGSDDGKPYPYIKAEAANSEFVATFEEFLREVWVGITYVTANGEPVRTAYQRATRYLEMLARVSAGRFQYADSAKNLETTSAAIHDQIDIR